MQAVMKLLLQMPSVAETGSAANRQGALTFVQGLMTMDMDTQHQAQLIHAWLAVVEQSPLKAWQAFVGNCSKAQVCFYTLACCLGVHSYVVYHLCSCLNTLHSTGWKQKQGLFQTSGVFLADMHGDPEYGCSERCPTPQQLISSHLLSSMTKQHALISVVLHVRRSSNCHSS